MSWSPDTPASWKASSLGESIDSSLSTSTGSPFSCLSDRGLMDATGQTLDVTVPRLEHSLQMLDHRHPVHSFSEPFGALPSPQESQPALLATSSVGASLEPHHLLVAALEAGLTDVRSELAAQKHALDDVRWTQQRMSTQQPPPQQPPVGTTDLIRAVQKVSDSVMSDSEASFGKQIAALSMALEEMREQAFTRDSRLDEIEQIQRTQEQVWKQTNQELQDIRRRVTGPSRDKVMFPDTSWRQEERITALSNKVEELYTLHSENALHLTAPPQTAKQHAAEEATEKLSRMVQDMKRSIEEERVVRGAELSRLQTALSVNSSMPQNSLEAARVAFRDELRDELSLRVDPLTEGLQRLASVENQVVTVDNQVRNCTTALSQLDDVLNSALGCLDHIVKRFNSEFPMRGVLEGASDVSQQVARLRLLEAGDRRRLTSGSPSRRPPRAGSRSVSKGPDGSDDFEAGLMKLSSSVQHTLKHGSRCPTPDGSRDGGHGTALPNMMSNELKLCLESLGEKVDMTLMRELQRQGSAGKLASPLRRPPSPNKLGCLQSGNRSTYPGGGIL